jgi:hypothetical protein
MQAILTSLSNARWANAEQTAIDCEITTSQFGDEVLPFTASANDCDFSIFIIAGLGCVSQYQFALSHARIIF